MRYNFHPEASSIAGNVEDIKTILIISTIVIVGLLFNIWLGQTRGNALLGQQVKLLDEIADLLSDDDEDDDGDEPDDPSGIELEQPSLTR